MQGDRLPRQKGDQFRSELPAAGIEVAGAEGSGPLDAVKSARETFAIEIAGLEALAGSINARFPAVVNMLKACRGRVFVTGCGKSGHIAEDRRDAQLDTGLLPACRRGRAPGSRHGRRQRCGDRHL